MVAVAYPPSTRRDRRTPGGAPRAHRSGLAYLRLLEPPGAAPSAGDQRFEDPFFDDPVFRELAAPARDLSVWSAAERPVAIPRHVLLPGLWALAEPVGRPVSGRPSPRRPAPGRVGAGRVGAGRAGAGRHRERHLPVAAGRPAPSFATRRARPAAVALRRLAASALASALMFGVLCGASALAGVHQGAPAVLAGSVRTAAGYEYTIQPGDTLWSIASRVYPQGDPRALVASLSAQLHGVVPVPGARVLLP